MYSNENILQETTTDTTTNTTKTRDYINWLWTDELVALEENSQRYYYHKDHLWSIVWITDNSWNTVVEYDYDVFGKAKVISWDANFENTRLYTGREYDTELWLYYNRARYYNPELARFISRDPIDIKDDVNLYAYVGNNGVMFVDRMGTSKAITADEFRIAFVNAYDDYLSTKRKLENNINIYYAWQRVAWSSSTADASNKFLKLRTELKEKEEIAKQMHYDRNIYNDITDWFTIKDAQNNWWKDVNLNQSAYHQYLVPKWKENDKWISSDWHKEVVFSYLDGSIVSEVENMGTYNFYWLWTTEIINHYKYDVKPYYEWWSWPNDNQIFNK